MPKTKRKRDDGGSAAPSQPQANAGGTGGTPKFGLMLGANDKATRDKAVQALTR